MDIGQRKKYLIEKLKNEKYRKAYISEHIDTSIPFQIKTIREQREWSQIELGENVHEPMKQEQVCRLENPNYSKFTLATLKRLAYAFNVGLVVRFVPISDLVKWDLDLTSESLKAVSFDDDAYFEDKPEETSPAEQTQINPPDAAESYIHVEDLPETAPDSKVITFRSFMNDQTDVRLNTSILNQCSK